MAEWKDWELNMLKTSDKSALDLSKVMNHSVCAIRRRRYELNGSYVVKADTFNDDLPVLISLPPGLNMTKKEKEDRIRNMARILDVKIGE